MLSVMVEVASATTRRVVGRRNLSATRGDVVGAEDEITKFLPVRIVASLRLVSYWTILWTRDRQKLAGEWDDTL